MPHLGIRFCIWANRRGLPRRESPCERLTRRATARLAARLL